MTKAGGTRRIEPGCLSDQAGRSDSHLWWVVDFLARQHVEDRHEHLARCYDNRYLVVLPLFQSRVEVPEVPVTGSILRESEKHLWVLCGTVFFVLSRQ